MFIGSVSVIAEGISFSNEYHKAGSEKLRLSHHWQKHSA